MSKSKKVRGRVGRSDLEGGYLTISDGNETWKLEGGGADLRPGVTVEVEGQVDSGMMGIGFGTKVLRVKSYKIV